MIKCSDGIFVGLNSFILFWIKIKEMNSEHNRLKKAKSNEQSNSSVIE
jgi:hypothetical protein